MSELDQTALACLELSSIARGILVLDQMVKRAPVRIRHRGRHSNGKYIILFDGDVASVEESYEAGMEAAQSHLVDHMMLATVHPQITDALSGNYRKPSGDAVLLAELTQVASILERLDATLKLIEANLVDLQLAMGIGGRGYFAVEAPLFDIEYARDELMNTVEPDLLIAVDIIARPHEEMWSAMGHRHPFADYEA